MAGAGHMGHQTDGTIDILIVDDMPQSLHILRGVLRSLGFLRVREAHNAKEAYAAIQQQCPDLLLTDWEMPGGAGVELVRAIRGRADSPDPLLPIIVITSHASPEYVRAGRDAGATHFLVKPYVPGRLMERIQDVALNQRPYIVSPTYRGPCRRRGDQRVPFDRRAPEGETVAGVQVVYPDGLLRAKLEGDADAVADAQKRRKDLAARLARTGERGPLFKPLPADSAAATLEGAIDGALNLIDAYTNALAGLATPLAAFEADRGTALPAPAVKLIASLRRSLQPAPGAAPDAKLVGLHLQALRAMLRAEPDEQGQPVARDLAMEIDALARATMDKAAS